MEDDYRELLLGCGHSRKRLLSMPGFDGPWKSLVTADHNIDCKPDLWVDLREKCWSSEIFLKFGADPFNEIHAYDVLEHLGTQGDVATFFSTFYNIWMLLKPDGYLFAITPSRFSGGLWGDPGHTRAILPESLMFLDRGQYNVSLGRTPMSDYREDWHGDFKTVRSEDNGTQHCFVLQAVKPVRDYIKEFKYE